MYQELTGEPHFSITVWAGSDLYRLLKLPVSMREQRVAYVELVRLLQPTIQEEFGEGAELVQKDTNQYYISVDKVAI